MIQYDTLYNMLISETTRFILGSWEDKTHNEEDLQELIRDISKCFYDEEGNYSSISSAIRLTMKSLEKIKNPITDQILVIRNIIISILFSQKYKSFKTPGDLYIAFEQFKKDVDTSAALRLKEQVGLTDSDVLSIKENGVNSIAVKKLESCLESKEPMYLSECIKYISLI